jgi:alpha-tubulin suppressor-like RCC1 family protein/uncharacterized protein YjdB
MSIAPRTPPFARRARVALLSLLLAGCSDGALGPTALVQRPHLAPPGAAPIRDVSPGIQDGAHAGGNGHFYFLPPMAAAPTPAGTFDATQSPEVEICRYTATACTPLAPAPARFTMTSGPGGATVRLDAAAELYVLNWNTQGFTLSTTDTYRIRVLVAGTELGHADVQVVNNGSELKELASGGRIGLVDGRTLPIKFRVEKGAVFKVPTGGGTYQTPVTADGGVTIAVPAGAVPSDFGLTVLPTKTYTLETSAVATAAYEFGPDGSTFPVDKPLKVTIQYDEADLPQGFAESRLRLHMTEKDATGAIQWVEADGSTVDVAANTVSGYVTHFSGGVPAIPQPVGSVTVTPNPAQLQVLVTPTLAMSAQLTTIKGTAAKQRVVSWSSSNPAIATVDANGLVTAVAAGSAIISATSEGVVGQAAVAVLPAPVENVVVEPSLATVSVGEEITLAAVATSSDGAVLTGRLVEWSSMNPDFATVDEDGVVTGIAEGPARIRATVEGRVAIANVIVTAPRVASVAFAPHALALDASATTPLTVTALDGSGNPIIGRAVTWSITGSGSATITSDGLLTGTAAGPITVTASVDGVTSSTSLIVNQFGAIAIGGQSCALRAGAAYCWGSNNLGQLGDGTNTIRNTPVAVVGGHAFVTLRGRGGHTCGLTSDGTAYCWGTGTSGQLGDGAATNRNVPVRVAGGLVFRDIAPAQSHTCAVTTAGEAYCWGINNFGKLGDGTGSTRLTPTRVAGGLSFVAVSAGLWHSCALTAAGQAYCWGQNALGQLGNGGTAESAVPTLVAMPEPVAQLSVGWEHTCAVSIAGAVYCWGDNQLGEVGSNTRANVLPFRVSAAGTFQQVSGGIYFTCAVTPTKEGYCWGRNEDGRLGVGDYTARRTPTRIVGGLTFTDVRAGWHACGLATDGRTYCWGSNGEGALGDGTFTGSNRPVLVRDP